MTHPLKHRCLSILLSLTLSCMSTVPGQAASDLETQKQLEREIATYNKIAEKENFSPQDRLNLLYHFQRKYRNRNVQKRLLTEEIKRWENAPQKNLRPLPKVPSRHVDKDKLQRRFKKDWGYYKRIAQKLNLMPEERLHFLYFIRRRLESEDPLPDKLTQEIHLWENVRALANVMDQNSKKVPTSTPSQKTPSKIPQEDSPTLLAQNAEAKKAMALNEQKAKTPSDSLLKPPTVSAPEKVKNSFFSLKPEPKVVNKRVTLALTGMPLIQILKALSAQTGANFIIAKELQNRKFSAFLDNVKLRSALKGLLESQGLGYERVGDSSTFVIKEFSQTKVRLTTRIFRLKYTQMASLGGGDEESGGDSVVSGGEVDSGGSSEEGGSGGSDIQAVVKSMLSEHGRLQVHAQTNSLIVTDVPENLPRIGELIEGLDTLMPQVLIETIIMEANTDTARNLGLEFGSPDGTLASIAGPSQLLSGDKLGKRVTSKELGNASIKDTSLFGSSADVGVFFGMLSFQQFTSVLKAVETSGDGQFLAKPKILTLNNKTAQIAVTAETAIGVQSASLIAQSGLLSTTAERHQTGINLKVTPQINEGGLITLMIEPTISRPQSSQFFPGQFVDPQTRSIRTSVRVRNGETLLIGGLLSNERATTGRKVPFFSRIPLLGRLFKSQNKQSAKRELMIFITPRIVVL